MFLNFGYSQLDNGSFERWIGNEYPYPENWNMVQNFNQFNGIQKTNDLVDGQNAIIIHNWYYYIVAEIGTKQAITKSPITLSGYYKLITEDTNDLKSKGVCEIRVLDINSNYIGGAEHYFDSNSTYTYFEIPINYSLTSEMNSKASAIEIKFKSSNNFFCKNSDCNFFYLDKLELNYEVTSTKELTSDKIKLKSNLVENEINIQGLDGPSNISIKDLNGRVLLSSISSGKENVSFLKSGFYVLFITTSDGQMYALKFYKN